MKVKELKLNPKNPRRISPDHLDKLASSITNFPKMMELRPIVYDPETMQVLAVNTVDGATNFLALRWNWFTAFLTFC